MLRSVCIHYAVCIQLKDVRLDAGRAWSGDPVLSVDLVEVKKPSVWQAANYGLQAITITVSLFCYELFSSP